MSDPTAGTRGFVAGLIKAMEHMPDGEARDQVQAICDGVQARDSTGPVHWMTEDGIAVWVQPWKPQAGAWVTSARGQGTNSFPHAVCDTREAALGVVAEVIELCREGEARRVAGRTGHG